MPFHRDLKATLSKFNGLPSDQRGQLVATLLLVIAAGLLLEVSTRTAFESAWERRLIIVLLGWGCLWHLVIQYTREPTRSERGAADAADFKAKLDEYLEARFGRGWKLIIAIAGLLAAVLAVRYGIDSQSLHNEIQASIQRKEALKDSIARLSAGFRVAGNVLSSNEAIFRGDVGVRPEQGEPNERAIESFRSAELVRELELLSFGLQQRQLRIFGLALEGQAEGGLEVDVEIERSKQFAAIVAQPEMARCTLPKADDPKPIFAEYYLFSLARLLRYGFFDRDTPQEHLSCLAAHLERATGGLGAEALNDWKKASTTTSAVEKDQYLSYLKGQLLMNAAHLIWITGKQCYDSFESSSSTRIPKKERACSALVRSVRTDVSGALPNWVETSEARSNMIEKELLPSELMSLVSAYLNEADAHFHSVTDGELFRARVDWIRGFAEYQTSLMWKVHKPVESTAAAVDAEAAWARSARFADIYGKRHALESKAVNGSALNSLAWLYATNRTIGDRGYRALMAIRYAKQATDSIATFSRTWFERHDTYVQALAGAGFFYDAVFEQDRAIRRLKQISASNGPPWARDALQGACDVMFRKYSSRRFAGERGILADAKRHYDAKFNALSDPRVGRSRDANIALKLARIDYIESIEAETCKAPATSAHCSACRILQCFPREPGSVDRSIFLYLLAPTSAPVACNCSAEASCAAPYDVSYAYPPASLPPGKDRDRAALDFNNFAWLGLHKISQGLTREESATVLIEHAKDATVASDLGTLTYVDTLAQVASKLPETPDPESPDAVDRRLGSLAALMALCGSEASTIRHPWEIAAETFGLTREQCAAQPHL